MNGHATLFLADLPNPAIKIERTLDTIDSSFTGGHAVMSFTDLRLPADSVLGEIGKGFRYAQVRLAPARLSHCMRWLGSANQSAGHRHRLCPRPRRRKAARRARGRVVHAGRQPDGRPTGRGSPIWHTAWMLDRRRAGVGWEARCPR